MDTHTHTYGYRLLHMLSNTYVRRMYICNNAGTGWQGVKRIQSSRAWPPRRRKEGSLFTAPFGVTAPWQEVFTSSYFVHISSLEGPIASSLSTLAGSDFETDFAVSSVDALGLNKHTSEHGKPLSLLHDSGKFHQQQNKDQHMSKSNCIPQGHCQQQPRSPAAPALAPSIGRPHCDPALAPFTCGAGVSQEFYSFPGSERIKNPCAQVVVCHGESADHGLQAGARWPQSLQRGSRPRLLL